MLFRIHQRLLRALGSDGGGTGSSSLWVQVVGRLGWLQLVVQLVNQWDTSRDVQAGNLLVGDVVQVLDQTSQGVTVGGNENSLAQQQVSGNVVLVVWQHSVDDQLQGLSLWNHSWVKVSVTSVTNLGVLGISLNNWRWHVERSSPDLELLLTVLLQGLGLVLTLQGTVVSLVQSPGSLDRHVQLVGGFQGQVGGLDGSGQLGGVQNVHGDTGLLDQLSSLSGLLTANIRQTNINPTSEQVLLVPFGLSVSDQNKLGIFSISDCGCGCGF